MTTFNLSDFKVCDKGEFGDIFIDEVNKKAFKIFKSYDYPAPLGKEAAFLYSEDISGGTNDYRKRVFDAQIKAYTLVQQSELLKTYTPIFYGKVEVEKVIKDEKDITPSYLVNCCYEMEFIKGNDYKLEELKKLPLLQEIEGRMGFKLIDIIKEFEKLRINFTRDSSVIYNKDEFKIIDFEDIRQPL